MLRDLGSCCARGQQPKDATDVHVVLAPCHWLIFNPDRIPVLMQHSTDSVHDLPRLSLAISHRLPNGRRVSGSRRAEGDERVRCTRMLDGRSVMILMPCEKRIAHVFCTTLADSSQDTDVNQPLGLDRAATDHARR